jgi:hypothetical protein
VVEISLGDFKIDFVDKRGNTLLVKQIERRNGLVFMRLKKRNVEEK